MRNFIAHRHDGSTVIEVDKTDMYVDDFDPMEFRWITEEKVVGRHAYTTHYIPSSMHGMRWEQRSQVLVALD